MSIGDVQFGDLFKIILIVNDDFASFIPLLGTVQVLLTWIESKMRTNVESNINPHLFLSSCSLNLDDLILELRDSLGATVVVVTHELASIFAIGDNSVFLDPETRTMIASGNPKEMLANPPNEKVHTFLSRGEA